MTRPTLVASGTDSLVITQATGMSPVSKTITVPSGGTNRILLIKPIAIFNPASFADVKAGGVSIQHLTGANISKTNTDSTGEAVDLWYLLAPANGSLTIDVYGSQSGQWSGFFSEVWQDVDQGSPFGTPLTNFHDTGGTPASPAVLGTITSGGTDDVVVSHAAVLDQLDSLGGNGTVVGSNIHESANTGVTFRSQYHTSASPNPNFSYNGFNASTGDFVAMGVKMNGVGAGGGGFALLDSEWHPMEPQTNPLTVSVW